jgi:VCBS repeat-containing protein
MFGNKGFGDGSVWSTGTGGQFPNRYAFAALREDGSVVTWGDSRAGGDSSAVAGQLDAQNSPAVTQVFSTWGAFAALREDGSVVTWGGSGGNSSAVAAQLDAQGSSAVTQVFSTWGAFAALREDGSVVTWGGSGGNSSAVAAQLDAQGSSAVTQVFSTRGAFAALREDGSVVTWGLATVGGNSNAVAGQLDAQGSPAVTQVLSTNEAFAALREDGSVVTWGGRSSGGNSIAVAEQLNAQGSPAVTQVFSTERAFAALREDGSVVTWGRSDWGGESGAVADQLASGVIGLASPFGSPAETGLGEGGASTGPGDTPQPTDPDTPDRLGFEITVELGDREFTIPVFSLGDGFQSVEDHVAYFDENFYVRHEGRLVRVDDEERAFLVAASRTAENIVRSSFDDLFFMSNDPGQGVTTLDAGVAAWGDTLDRFSDSVTSVGNTAGLKAIGQIAYSALLEPLVIIGGTMAAGGLATGSAWALKGAVVGLVGGAWSGPGALVKSAIGGAAGFTGGFVVGALAAAPTGVSIAATVGNVKNPADFYRSFTELRDVREALSGNEAAILDIDEGITFWVQQSRDAVASIDGILGRTGVDLQSALSGQTRSVGDIADINTLLTAVKMGAMSVEFKFALAQKLLKNSQFAPMRDVVKAEDAEILAPNEWFTNPEFYDIAAAAERIRLAYESSIEEGRAALIAEHERALDHLSTVGPVAFELDYFSADMLAAYAAFVQQDSALDLVDVTYPDMPPEVIVLEAASIGVFSGQPSEFRGSAENLNQSAFLNMREQHSVVVEGVEAAPENIRFELGSVIVHIDTNGDGIEDLTLNFPDLDVARQLEITAENGNTVIRRVADEDLAPNSPASIAGDTTGLVVEDDPDRAQTSGVLSVSDPDAGEDRFAAVDPAVLAGDFGAFAFDPWTGAWSYTLDNRSAAVQALPKGEELRDELIVTSIDSTAEEVVTVTILGTGVNTPEPSETVALLGTISDRAGRPLDGSTVTFTPDDGSDPIEVTNTENGFNLAAVPGASGHIVATRPYDPSTDGNVTALDALNVLRLAVGLSPSWGTTSPMDFIAADINQDGRVTALDALAGC